MVGYFRPLGSWSIPSRTNLPSRSVYQTDEADWSSLRRYSRPIQRVLCPCHNRLPRSRLLARRLLFRCPIPGLLAVQPKSSTEHGKHNFCCSTWLKSFRMRPTLPIKRRNPFIFIASCLLLTCFAARPQKAPAGRIVGHIDGVSRDGDHYFLLGWACQQGQSKSINVQLFGIQTTNGVTKDGPLFAETAHLFSEPGVAEVCRRSEACQKRASGKLGPETLMILSAIPSQLFLRLSTGPPHVCMMATSNVHDCGPAGFRLIRISRWRRE